VKTLLQALKKYDSVELQIIATSSFISKKFGQAVGVLQSDGLEPAWVLNTLLEADSPFTAAKSTGLQAIELSTAFQNLRPDLVVTIADRYETMATAIAATYANIPLVHLQGGEVTGNIDEKVRHAITKMADLHLVCTDSAAERVIRLGEHPRTVHNVGCPSIDIAKEVLSRSDTKAKFRPFSERGGVGEDINFTDPFLVVLQHPVTTEIQKARDHISETLFAVQSLNIPTIVMWPNPDSGTEGTAEGIRIFRETGNPSKFYFSKNIRPEDFLRMLTLSRCLIGNSSVGIRECSYLGVPVVNIGTRQTDRQRGSNVIDVEHKSEQIIKAINQQLKHGKYQSDYIYGKGSSGQKAAKVIVKFEPKTQKRLTF